MHKLVFLILSTLLISHSATSETNTLSFEPLDNNSIRRHKSKCYSGGIMAGMPVKGSLRGLIFDTWEMEIMLGKFPHDHSYLGSTLAVSTESEKVFKQFLAASKNAKVEKKAYVFEYDYPFCLNPEIESTHWHITGMRLLKDNFWESGMPEEIVATDRRRGNYSTGTRQGRISRVERRGWDYFEPTCVMTMKMGGLKRSGAGTDENTASFTIYGEHACRYAEALMSYDVDVEVEYSEDYVELFHGEAKNAHVIRAVDSRRSEQQEFDAIVEKIKESILEDPEFLEKLRDAL